MPFCPTCGIRVPGGAARCELDGSILRVYRCKKCEGEVAPQEKYCGHCGCHFANQPYVSYPLQLQPASWWRRWACAGFDGLAWMMLVNCFLSLEPILPWLTLPLVAASVESWDAQTPGQHVFGLKRLCNDGEVLPKKVWWACLKAALLPFLGQSTRLFWIPR